MQRLPRTMIVVLSSAASVAALAAPASADKDYRTQKYAVTDDAGSVLGFVVNTHAEGPVNYGIERYALKGAAAGKYQVSLQIYEDSECTDPAPLPIFLTTTMTTNEVGNAHGGAVFSASDVATIVFQPATVYGIWRFSTGGTTPTTTYSTGCEQIVLDVP